MKKTFSNTRIWKIILRYLSLLRKSCSLSSFRISGFNIKFKQQILGIPYSIVLKYMNIWS